MIDPPSPPASRLALRLRALREIVALCAIVAAFSTSVTILVMRWNATELSPQLSPTSTGLEALLLQRGSRLEVYSAEGSRGTVRTITLPGELKEAEFRPRLISPRAVLLTTASGTLVRDMGSTYAYDPLPGSARTLTHVNRNTQTIYSLHTDGRLPHLVITSALCGLVTDLPLQAIERWYVPVQLFASLGLQEQRQMRLSPAETALVTLDHTVYPRLIVTDLMQHTAQMLTVPGFAPEQLHFSPLFTDEETLVFSVLDRTHWGTVRYHRSTGTYEVLSDAFTDRALLTTDGRLVLAQSFYGNATNIPFGSVSLLEHTFPIPLRQVESILSSLPSAQGTLIREELFQEPLQGQIFFRASLAQKTFNDIEDPAVREQLRTLWLERRARIAAAPGAFHILMDDDAGVLTQVTTMTFEIENGNSILMDEKDLEKLLTLLRLPQATIAEYRRRTTEAGAEGVRARFVDAL